MNKFGIVKAIESLSGILFIGILLYLGFNNEGFKVATIAMMVCQGLLVGFARVSGVKLNFSQKALFFITYVLGGMTLILNDPMFVQIRTTVVNFSFATILLFSHFWRGRTVMEWMFDQILKDKNISIPKTVLHNISYWTIGYMYFTGLLNFYVVKYHTKEFWGAYKYTVGLGLSFFFMLFMIYKLKDYLMPMFEEEQRKKESEKNKNKDF